MGCFSNLAAEHIRDACDHSITAPEQQLLWRLDALEDRYRQLTAQKTGRRDEGVCFSEDNLRYVLPEHFLSASDVRKAIDLAVLDLAERYGIYLQGTPAEELPVMDEITGMQISFLDILSAQTCREQLQAA